MSLYKLPPGWYTNTTDPGWQHYWDGSAWTHRRPLPPTNETAKESNEPAKDKPKGWIELFKTGGAAGYGNLIVALLIGLGVLTGGGVVVKVIVDRPGGNSTGSSNGGRTATANPTVTPSPTVTSTAAFPSALLKPCDLGPCTGFFGWVKTQASSPLGPLSCPTLPQKEAGYENTALLDNDSQLEVTEEIWRVANPSQVVSTYTNTAQNCTSAPNNSGQVFAYQADYSDGSYGDQSVVFSLGWTYEAAPGTPTIVGYDAVIAKGNLVASVYVDVNSGGSESDLPSIFKAATKKLG
jgi:hypothetical protein